MFQTEGGRPMLIALFNPEVAKGIIIENIYCMPIGVQQINITELLVQILGLDDLEGIQESLESIDTWFGKAVRVKCSEPMGNSLVYSIDSVM